MTGTGHVGEEGAVVDRSLQRGDNIVPDGGSSNLLQRGCSNQENTQVDVAQECIVVDQETGVAVCDNNHTGAEDAGEDIRANLPERIVERFDETRVEMQTDLLHATLWSCATKSWSCIS